MSERFLLTFRDTYETELPQKLVFICEEGTRTENVQYFSGPLGPGIAIGLIEQ